MADHNKGVSKLFNVNQWDVLVRFTLLVKEWIDEVDQGMSHHSVAERVCFNYDDRVKFRRLDSQTCISKYLTVIAVMLKIRGAPIGR